MLCEKFFFSHLSQKVCAIVKKATAFFYLALVSKLLVVGDVPLTSEYVTLNNSLTHEWLICGYPSLPTQSSPGLLYLDGRAGQQSHPIIIIGNIYDLIWIKVVDNPLFHRNIINVMDSHITSSDLPLAH